MVLPLKCLKESTMAGFNFRDPVFEWPEKITAGTYLWIWNADKVPPHIGISRGQNYFSLTYRNCEIQKSVSGMVRKAKRTGIPLVLVAIHDWEFTRDFTSVFQQYETAKAGGPTCLYPIRELLGLESTAHQLADLLTEIENRQQLKRVFALNLGTDFRAIPDYSIAEIMSRIELLHEAKRTKG